MTRPQIAELRVALAKMQHRDDDRGYQRWAGIHGLPGEKYCDRAHGQPSFLPWHRAYLYRFEQALRDTGHDVMLPWWDWTKTRRLPDPYTEAERPNGQPNPMRSVRINQRALDEGARERASRRTVLLSGIPDTFREPNLPGSVLPNAGEVKRILGYTDFTKFSEELENRHGDVHVWVGGHMTDIPFAAYDPIFWAHHCMIDRLWRIWQLHNSRGSFPASVLGQVMEPFHLTGAQVADPTALGYDYALSVTQVRP